MDPLPPANSRARRLYSRILADLQVAKSAQGRERDAVLLRVSDMVGELAEIAEGAETTTAAPDNEGPMRGEVFFLLSRISLELLRILGGADFYSELRRIEANGTRWRLVVGSSDQADSDGRWPVAA